MTDTAIRLIALLLPSIVFQLPRGIHLKLFSSEEITFKLTPYSQNEVLPLWSTAEPCECFHSKIIFPEIKTREFHLLIQVGDHTFNSFCSAS